jgi:DNA-directed RNA polymerase subunit RPC12/RpoP
MKLPLPPVRFEQGRCLNCGRKLTGYSAFTAGGPSAGDVMVCGYCSHIMEWDGDRVVELSDQAVKDIAGDPDVLAALEFARHFQKTDPR